MEGAALCRGQFHQSVGTVLPAQAEDREDQGRGRDCPEKDAEPPVHPGHVQDDEHEEDGEQASGKDIEILRLQPAEFHAPVGPFVHFMFHDRRITGERPQDGGGHDQEHAGSEPAAGNFTRIGIA